ncbi:sugar phosphate isomerase/epimerase [Ruminococcaceae bacterium OttesenSCG-928-O06]|nr:sugar phosphate isomerase/epimerase [Ruminococcaceae bacterium OttesenSCG-928-O06]
MPHLRKEQLAGMGIHYKYHSLDYFLACQQDLGFKTIEMWCCTPHFILDDVGYQSTAELKKKVEDHGLHIGVFTPECASMPYLICAHDEVAQKKALGYYTNGIRAAGEVGAKVMLTNCCGGDWNEDPERTFERAAKMLRALAPIAADCGVTMAVETVRPEESRMIITLPQLQRLLAEVDHPNVKAALDLTAVGVAGETVKQWFEALGSDIVHMHFADGRPYGHLVWGDGLHPLEDYIALMNQYGYEGYLGQEITDGRYYADPREADRRNFAAFEPYFV